MGTHNWPVETVYPWYDAVPLAPDTRKHTVLKCTGCGRLAFTPNPQRFLGKKTDCPRTPMAVWEYRGLQLG